MLLIRQVPWLPSGTKPGGMKPYIQNICVHPVETTLGDPVHFQALVDSKFQCGRLEQSPYHGRSHFAF